MKNLLMSWIGSTGYVTAAPSQSLSEITDEFELTKSRNGMAIVYIGAQAGVEAESISAPPVASAPTVVSATACRVVSAVCGNGSAVGVMLFNGSGSTDPRWFVPATLPILPAAPLLFPDGLSVRAVSGITSIPIFIQWAPV